MSVLVIPFLLQGMIIFIDEFYFHKKRGLPLWEKWGHPLDTFFVLLCYLFLVFTPFGKENLKIYVGLCAFSCLFITKDEFVHSQKCEPMENWLHSLLFILHPICFLSAGLIWVENKNPFVLIGQSAILTLFMLYQLIYWSSFNESKQRNL